MDFAFLLIGNGILIGLMYSLIALGFALVSKATDASNFARGEFVMLAALIAGALIVGAGLPFWVAVIVVLAGMIGFSFALERVVVRPLLGRPIVAVIMATIGRAAILRGMGPFIFGPGTRSIGCRWATSRSSSVPSSCSRCS